MNEQILTEEMLKFIEESPTAFHAAANVEKLLLQEGFMRIEELGAEKIQPGGRYYTVQNGSAVIAARIPENGGPVS